MQNQRGSVFIELLTTILLICGFIFESAKIGQLFEERAVLKESVRLAARVSELQGRLTVFDIESRNLDTVIETIAEKSLNGMHYNPADYDVTSKVMYDNRDVSGKVVTLLKVAINRKDESGLSDSILLGGSRPCVSTVVPIHIDDFQMKDPGEVEAVDAAGDAGGC